MTANKSFLSSQKYGYDFVVATTQASINLNLRNYLNTCNQPATYLCFLANDQGNPTVEVSLDKLKTQTGGVNPFEIPNGTDFNDPRITTLLQNRFQVGLKLKLGLPPGVMPDDLPPIVELGSSANNVGFNLLCSEFQVIQLTPGGGYAKGSWDVWSQPSGTPWYFKTNVNLLYKDLDKELGTRYFDNHPAEKQALLNQLQNLSGSAYSLQQLLFDLDNAALQTVPKIDGMDPGSNAAVVLLRSFVNIYSASAKEHGEPLLSVHAVVHDPDPSTLHLTGMEREVNQFVDGNGEVVPNPTPEQRKVTTLNYLCAANNNPLPGAAGFSWNWVEPADVGKESGVISVNRNALANYYKNILVPFVKKSCIKASCSINAHWWGDVNYHWTLSTGQTPQHADITPSGSTVLNISYESDARGYDKSGVTAGELKIHTPYTCSVSFSGNTITIVQHLKVWVYARWDYTSADANLFDKTITDVYTLSIGQNGRIQISAPQSSSQDRSQDAHRSGFINFFTGINDLTDDIKKKISGFVSTQIHDVPAARLDDFVFPGGKVFTYKDVQFSDNQDLVSKITYK